MKVLARLLTTREIEVLRLLAHGCTCRQTARQLCVSALTVQTHTKNIYLKLEVHSARAAIWRALELGLLSTSPGENA
jgi:ATP/maltotriose-dependent transcriptional regulator MalT